MADLAFEQEVLRIVLSQTHVGIAVLDQDFSVVYGNPDARRYLAAYSDDQKCSVVEGCVRLAERLYQRESLFHASSLRYECAGDSYEVVSTPYCFPRIGEDPAFFYLLHISRSEWDRKAACLLGIAAQHFGLSPRELEVLRLLVAGRSDSEISEALSISVHTVKAHDRVIYRKLDVSGRTELLDRLVGFYHAGFDVVPKGLMHEAALSSCGRE